MMNLSWIPILASLWLMLKVGHELYAQLKYYKKGVYVEQSESHTHQHLGVSIGVFIYALCVILMIVWGDYVFSIEWMPLMVFIDIILLYVNEHFAIEREEREDIIRIRDLFRFRKIQKIEGIDEIEEIEKKDIN